MLERFVQSTASFSNDLKYRYLLTRRWEREGNPVTFIMLNPSTADEEKFDPTVKRCYNYAHAWGFGELIVCNLYAFRSTDPKNLKKEADPVGEDNEDVIVNSAVKSSLIIAAWGTHGTYLGRDKEVITLITEILGQSLYCLDITKDGHPAHPLYQKAELKPRLFRQAVRENTNDREE